MNMYFKNYDFYSNQWLYKIIFKKEKTKYIHIKF